MVFSQKKYNYKLDMPLFKWKEALSSFLLIGKFYLNLKWYFNGNSNETKVKDVKLNIFKIFDSIVYIFFLELSIGMIMDKIIIKNHLHSEKGVPCLDLGVLHV